MQTPAQILRRHGLRPKDSWGQNFLGDDASLAAIADAANLGPADTVVELGAGLGHLTRHLVERGCRVVAVERDRELVPVLEAELGGRAQVVAGNAVEIDFSRVAATSPVVVMGNLPYHLTSPILFRVLDQRAQVSRAVFTLQEEVVERLAAAPGSRSYGIPTVLLGLHFVVQNVLRLPRGLFYPSPKVDSAVVRLVRRERPAAPVQDEERFARVVKAAFAHRRKTLLNSLKSDTALAKAEVWPEALARSGIEPGRRAETLSLEEFAALERALGSPT